MSVALSNFNGNVHEKLADALPCPATSASFVSSSSFARGSSVDPSTQAPAAVGEHDDLSEFCHPVLYKTCRHLGMRNDAIRDWIAAYDSPGTMASYFISAALGVLCVSFIYTYFHPEVTWKVQAPLAISMSSEALNTLGLWRNGPKHAQTRLCQVLVALWAIPLMIISAITFSRPEPSLPFASQAAFCGAFSTVVFFAVVTCKAGRVPAMRQPKLSSALALLTDSTTISIRIMDTLTSILLVRGIIDEARGSCFWFGTYGQCSKLAEVAITIAIGAGTDVTSGLSLAALRHMRAPYASTTAHPRASTSARADGETIFHSPRSAACGRC
eukprot:jgi/Ulvmu1/1297/UM011_0021.1